MRTGSCRGDHTIKYMNIQSLCCTLEIYVILCQLYFNETNKKGFKIDQKGRELREGETRYSTKSIQDTFISNNAFWIQ